MAVKEIDFQLVEDKAASKVFKFTNEDGSVYDMTSSTAKLLLYLTDTPTEIVCSIDVNTGKITVPFTSTHTENQGTFEYVLEETKVTLEVVTLVKGNIMVIEYVPFSQSIEAYLNSELPANLTLTMDFRNQRIMFWRQILQSAFNISDANLNVESAWPDLVNALLAKLVVYDALMLASIGSFVQFLGGDYTSTETIGGGGVKRVTTGPTEVEYFDTAQSARQAFSATTGQISQFEALKEGLCGLSSYLGVKLHMCPDSKQIIVPQYHQNPDWDYPTLDDFDDLIERQPSQG